VRMFAAGGSQLRVIETRPCRLFLAVLAFSTPAYAASFDCAKASQCAWKYRCSWERGVMRKTSRIRG